MTRMIFWVNTSKSFFWSEQVQLKRKFRGQRVALYVIANWIGVLDKPNDETSIFRLYKSSFLKNPDKFNWSLLQAKIEDLNHISVSVV